MFIYLANINFQGVVPLQNGIGSCLLAGFRYPTGCFGIAQVKTTCFLLQFFNNSGE